MDVLLGSEHVNMAHSRRKESIPHGVTVSQRIEEKRRGGPPKQRRATPARPILLDSAAGRGNSKSVWCVSVSCGVSIAFLADP